MGKMFLELIGLVLNGIVRVRNKGGVPQEDFSVDTFWEKHPVLFFCGLIAVGFFVLWFILY